MNPVFVDANVFLRFFTTDEGGQHARDETLFRAETVATFNVSDFRKLGVRCHPL